MALNEFHFENRGPLDKVRCNEVPDLMVIAGPNGVGKTTLLNSIASEYQSRFSSYLQMGAEEIIKETNKIVKNFKGKNIETGDIIGNTTFSQSSESQTNVAFVGPHRGMSGGIDIQKSHLIGMPKYSSKLLYSLANTDQNTLNNWLRRGQGNIRAGPYRDRQKGSSDQLPYYEVRRRLSQIQYNVDDYLKEKVKNQEEVNDTVRSWLSPIQEAIEEVLPGIELEKVKETDDYKYILQFKNRDGSIVKFNELSSGEKDAIALLFLLVEDEIENQFENLDIVDESEEDLVVLYDSPEAYLHPQLQLTFINFIKEYLENDSEYDKKVQIIICTHSKMVIDNVPEESLYYLYFPDQVEENQLQPSSEVPDELQTLISEEIGLTALSSGEDMLLVEGEDDREVLHRMADDLHKDLSIIQMGGKDRIIETSFNKLVPKLENNGINLYAIVDRDRDLQLENTVSENIHVLPMNSIENLVLQPEAIFETVKQYHGRDLSNYGHDDPDDIKSLLERIISDSEFVKLESQTRWNEQFNPFNVNYSGYEASSGFSNIDEFAKNELENRLSEIKSFSQIKEDVQELAENGAIDELHGKKILKEVSNEFGIPSEVLLRMSASNLEFQDFPQETKEFLQKARSN